MYATALGFVCGTLSGYPGPPFLPRHTSPIFIEPGYFLHVRDMRLSRQGSERLRLFRPVGSSPGRFRRAAARCAPQAMVQARKTWSISIHDPLRVSQVLRTPRARRFTCQLLQGRRLHPYRAWRRQQTSLRAPMRVRRRTNTFTVLVTLISRVSQRSPVC